MADRRTTREAGQEIETASPPRDATAFGVYVHWPFCAAKCPYCDFNSHVRHGGIDEARFAAALAREIAAIAARVPERRVSSIFLGGGTPSLMTPQTVAAILDAVSKAWHVDADAEITLEANPSSVEAGRFRGYRAAGVNRISLGVQSLIDADLKALGRLHDAAQARAAVEIGRSVFPRLSFDLIYARPGQTLDGWRAEFETAIGMAGDHLSLYQLTIEPGTPYAALYAAGKLAVPEAGALADFYALTQDIAETNGLPAYEISNHAAAGGESRHNLTYWRYQDYAGIGPGAHGRLTIDGVKWATMSEKHPEDWADRVEAAGHGLIVDEPLSREEAADEMLLMGLRLREGLSTRRYEAASGRPFDPKRLADLFTHGMIEKTAGDRLRATPAGWMVLDALVADIAA
jgi:oxygen-independent coproporphyrinogen-3 oxidase